MGERKFGQGLDCFCVGPEVTFQDVGIMPYPKFVKAVASLIIGLQEEPQLLFPPRAVHGIGIEGYYP